ncbi:MAG: hypothetical protein ING66_10345 [Rhodocyclaceae bacterium]|nr:hypothetical protein [Rhodocyclaceae bacterium]MCA3061120.1 hypothetical protein [Rhodocyclaceae bacterium]MCA3084616.1 hypothetical protein [Rhodocyclaceae bacterium]
MFEHIVLRRATDGLPISAGRIAEALFYYQKLHLFFDNGTLFHLVKQIGTKGILTLLNRPDVSAVYCEELLGTRTNSVGVSQYHDFVAMTLSGDKDVGQLKSPADRLQFGLERDGLSKTAAKQFAKAFLQQVPIRKLSGDYFVKGGISAAAKLDLLETEYAKLAIRQAVAAMPGGYIVGDDLKFDVIESSLGCFVFSNLNLDAINRRRSEASPSAEPITVAHLLSSILDARADLALASFYGGDFVTSNVTSSIIQVRHAEMLRRANLNADSRREFIEVVLPDSPSLAEVIDAGERTLDDFLLLLDKAARFKDWLKKVNPDEDLVRSYMRDITSEGWIQRLPAKTLRYILTVGLDATNPIAGLAAGLIDNFFVEKLLSGWRPNHFVTGKLEPFLRGY